MSRVSVVRIVSKASKNTDPSKACGPDQISGRLLQECLSETAPSSTSLITALFTSVRTLKLKAQSTNAFFATVTQMFGTPAQKAGSMWN